MSIESTTVLLNDLREHLQGIAYEINRITTYAPLAIEKQNSPSFNRTLYLAEHKTLEALIVLEENLYKHAEYLRITAGISPTPGGDFPGGLDPRREVRRGD